MSYYSSICECNNKYMKDYKNKKSSYLIKYLDVNYLS